MRLQHCLFIIALSFLPATANFAAVVYDETSAGDLSNSDLSPKSIILDNGSNEISGVTGSSGSGLDRDYFTVTVPTGATLNSISLLTGTTIGGGVSFIGVQSGNQVTLSPTSSSAAGLLGWLHYGDGDINSDILAKMATPSNGSSGFTPPLGSGAYSFWVQDFDSGQHNYRLAVNISQIPLPAAVWVFLSGIGLFSWQARRK